MEPDTGKRPRLGELLVREKTVTEGQVKEALRLQAQTGERIGSALVEAGALGIDDLLGALGRQLRVQAENLFRLTLQPAVVGAVPFAKIREYQVIPLSTGERRLSLAMLNPRDYPAISDIEFITGRSVQPMVVPSYQIAAAIKYMEDCGEQLEKPLAGAELEQIRSRRNLRVEHLDLKHLFQRLVAEGASDLLLTAGAPPSIKKDNEVQRIGIAFLTPREIRTYALSLLTPNQMEQFEREKEIDFAYTFPDIGRFRINVYQQRNSISLAARHIIEIIPGLAELGLPAWIEDFALKPQGLILVTGPTGHGKTTTLAALVEVINTKRHCNILTIEDPIEYLHKHKASNVNQREVGLDTNSFHDGLRRVFRQAPDVIVIGEMRDPESFAIALQAAETGHLVMSTLHSATSTVTIERIIDVFPPEQQQQIRVQIAENFLLILSQRLVPLKNGPGRVLAYEKLVNTFRVRNLIREGKTHQIRSMLQISSDDFIPIDQSLARLCIEGRIKAETGLKYCDSPSFFNDLVNKGIVREG